MKPTTPEAVEAAMDYAREMSQLVPATPKWTEACDMLYKLRIPDDDCTAETAARILVARVEELEVQNESLARIANAIETAARERIAKLEAKVAYLELEYTGWAADAKTIMPHQVIHE